MTTDRNDDRLVHKHDDEDLNVPPQRADEVTPEPTSPTTERSPAGPVIWITTRATTWTAISAMSRVTGGSTAGPARSARTPRRVSPTGVTSCTVTS